MAIAFVDNFLAAFNIFRLRVVENRDFQLYHLKIWKTDVSLQISNRAKFWSKIVTTLICFPMKAEIPYFSDLMLGGPRGDLWRLYFSICERCQSKNFRKIKSFKVKYRFPKSPRGPPPLQIWKAWNLSFHWKKKS